MVIDITDTVRCLIKFSDNILALILHHYHNCSCVRYYSPEELQNLGVGHQKLRVPGGGQVDDHDHHHGHH